MELGLGSLTDFKAFLSAHPQAMNSDHIRAIAERIRARGTAHIRRLGVCPAVVVGENFREGVRVNDIPGRSLAMLDLLDEHTQCNPQAEVLCFEGLTPFARLVGKVYPRAVCSEYAPDEESQRRIAPVPHVDAMNIQFREGAFDAIVSGDVFEHVPDLPKVLRECARVLRSGGALIATFPFAYGNQDTIQKALLEHGQIRYLMEPEYHGDPVRPAEGVLVFQIPGWDILDQCRAAGFSKVEMVYIADEARGIMATEIEGVFVLRALK